MTRHGVFMSSMMWLLWNGLTLRYWSQKAVSVRYEDFVAEPDAVLQVLGEVVDVDLGSLRTPDGSYHVAPSHSVSGNPVRFTTGSVRLVADDEWRTAMPVRKRAVVTVLTVPLLGRFAYPILPARV